MDCGEVKFTGHAIQRMFERSINVDDVLFVIGSGEVIAEYPEDTPFPSYLILGFIKSRPIHVVVAKDNQGKFCHIITAYPPDPAQWTADFKARRSS
jgi:hypothetical protein